MEADPLFPPFDLANVNRVQFRPLREFFLAQSLLFAGLPDGVAQDFEMFRFARHNPSAKHEGRVANTPNMGLFVHFLSCHSHKDMLTRGPVITGKVQFT